MITKFIKIVIIFANIGFSQAQYTTIPDANFEQELINQGIDSESTLDGQVLTSDINTITNLTIRSTNINYMSGIEGFVALTNLTVVDNENLTHLDLNSNNALTHLSCNNNLSLILNVENIINLEYLSYYNISDIPVEIGNKPNLTYINCSANLLTTIDITQCPNLEVLICESNLFNSIDISQNQKLEFINASVNNINEIDLSSNINLKVLFIWNNNLETINLDQNVVLEQLYCDNNNLTSVHIQNNTNELITIFDTTNNPNLTCVFVDNIQYSQTNWTNVDTNTFFVETESECEALAVNETTIENQIFVYPNPIKRTLRISDFNNKISKIVIYDLLGNVILKTNKNIIDFSKNKKSVYFLKILMKKGAIVNKKIIKI